MELLAAKAEGAAQLLVEEQGSRQQENTPCPPTAARELQHRPPATERGSQTNCGEGDEREGEEGGFTSAAAVAFCKQMGEAQISKVLTQARQ